jgi:hypothetical protein
MSFQRTKKSNKRRVDNLLQETNFWWKKNLSYVSKKRIRSWRALFIVVFFLGVFVALAMSVYYNIQNKSKAATGSAALSWKANAEADLAGYKLYYGTSPRTGANAPGGYTNNVDVGNVTSYTLNGLAESKTYYFSLAAYDTSKNESTFSGEISKTIPVTSTTCTSFTYSAWGACQSNNTQTRTVASSSPSGCTGGNPVLTQSCTYSNTCTSFTYSAWGACQSNNTQTRTVASSSPSGCTGGNPVLTRSCTYTPSTCTSFTYSAWGACQSNNTQTRTVASSSPAGCTGGNPVLTQTCTYSNTCTSFTYSAWGACQSNGTQTRTVASSSPSGCTGGNPVLTQKCTYSNTCTSFTYTRWTFCIFHNKYRWVTSKSPSGCTGGNPITKTRC